MASALAHKGCHWIDFFSQLDCDANMACFWVEAAKPLLGVSRSAGCFGSFHPDLRFSEAKSCVFTHGCVLRLVHL